MDHFSPETQDALNRLMELAELPYRNQLINAQALQEAVQALKGKLMQLKLAAPMPSVPKPPMPPDIPEMPAKAPMPSPAEPAAAAPTAAQSAAPKVSTYHGDKSVLIAGQLGIITHQLRQSFTRLGGEVTVANDAHTAIEAYKNKDFGLVIIDLYMPTETEGLRVLEEVRRLSVICKIKTDTIVLSPPSRKDKHMRDLCKSKGATIFLEKNEGWYNLILEYYQGEIDISHFASGE